jgi:hypothetical protein
MTQHFLSFFEDVYRWKDVNCQSLYLSNSRLLLPTQCKECNEILANIRTAYHAFYLKNKHKAKLYNIARDDAIEDLISIRNPLLSNFFNKSIVSDVLIIVFTFLKAVIHKTVIEKKINIIVNVVYSKLSSIKFIYYRIFHLIGH